MHTAQITIQALVEWKLKREATCGDDFAEAGFEMMGGCEVCGAMLAAYNAHPSWSGFWRCKYCIGDTGWTDVEDAAKTILAEPVEACEAPDTIEAHAVKVG